MYQSTEDLYANYSNSAHTLRSKASQTSSKMIAFATEQLEKSVLFSDLNQKKVTKEALHYIFEQFKFMRDNVHLLFSQNLCLIENAGHPLMNHILFVLSKHQVDENQIKEPHALMFHKFLLDLGMTEDGNNWQNVDFPANGDKIAFFGLTGAGIYLVDNLSCSL